LVDDAVIIAERLSKDARYSAFRTTAWRIIFVKEDDWSLGTGSCGGGAGEEEEKELDGGMPRQPPELRKKSMTGRRICEMPTASTCFSRVAIHSAAGTGTSLRPRPSETACQKSRIERPSVIGKRATVELATEGIGYAWRVS
jgi:hypothetical protein